MNEQVRKTTERDEIIDNMTLEELRVLNHIQRTGVFPVVAGPQDTKTVSAKHALGITVKIETALASAVQTIGHVQEEIEDGMDRLTVVCLLSGATALIESAYPHLVELRTDNLEEVYRSRVDVSRDLVCSAIDSCRAGDMKQVEVFLHGILGILSGEGESV